MSSAARRAREKENLRRAILDAARELFVTEDYAAVSMRRIAERIEYSPTTIYLYFKDKDEILCCLVEEGFELFSTALEKLAVIADPVERLRQAGYVYLDFALTQRHYFKIMFQMESEAFADVEEPKHEQGRRALGFISQCVQEAMDQGRFVAAAPAPILAHVAWSHVHGAAALTLADRLKMLPEASRQLFYDCAIDTLIRGLLIDPPPTLRSETAAFSPDCAG